MTKIVTFPNSILNREIELFDFNNGVNIDSIVNNMISTVLCKRGIGLAANQIGLSIRAFVFKQGNAFVACFNPTVLSASEETDSIVEGCLSFPGVAVLIDRPKHIKAQWQNTKGEIVVKELTGRDCKCFLHELDHLNGVTIKDRVDVETWNRVTRRCKNKVKK